MAPSSQEWERLISGEKEHQLLYDSTTSQITVEFSTFSQYHHIHHTWFGYGNISSCAKPGYGSCEDWCYSLWCADFSCPMAGILGMWQDTPPSTARMTASLCLNPISLKPLSHRGKASPARQAERWGRPTGLYNLFGLYNLVQLVNTWDCPCLTCPQDLGTTNNLTRFERPTMDTRI